MSKVYTRNTWVNDAPPAINATNLNNVEEGVLTNNRLDLSVVVTPPTDEDYTLTATENQYGRIEVDTTNWTTARNIIMNNDEHTFLAVVNNTGSQNATFKTSSGTGILVLNGKAKELRNDTVNVIDYEVSGFEIASTAEAQAGTNNTKAITPLRMREGFNASGTAPVYAPRAWVNFDASGATAIRASGNVSSLTDYGVGDTGVNFAVAMPDANYSVFGVCNELFDGGVGTSSRVFGISRNAFPTTTQVRVGCAVSSTTSLVDATWISVTILR